MSEEKKPKEKTVEAKNAVEAPQIQVSENTVFIGRKPSMNYVLACAVYRLPMQRK